MASGITHSSGITKAAAITSKIKLAVSGCARECAEARSKDVGIIATERWAILRIFLVAAGAMVAAAVFAVLP